MTLLTGIGIDTAACLLVAAMVVAAAAGLGLAFTPGPGVAGGCLTLGGGALDARDRVCGTAA